MLDRCFDKVLYLFLLEVIIEATGRYLVYSLFDVPVLFLFFLFQFLGLDPCGLLVIDCHGIKEFIKVHLPVDLAVIKILICIIDDLVCLFFLCRRLFADVEGDR